MHIHTPGRATTIHGINPGTLFIAKMHDAMCLCLAIEPLRGQGPPDAVAIIPGHPMVPGGPGMLSGQFFGNSTIFALEGAAIAFDVNLSNISTIFHKLPDNNKMIYNIDRKFYIRFNRETYQTVTVNVTTGSYEEPDLHNAAAILSWRVVWTDASGVTHEIARQDCRAGESG